MVLASRAVGEVQARVGLVTQALAGELEHWRMQPPVRALVTLRGVDSTHHVSQSD